MQRIGGVPLKGLAKKNLVEAARHPASRVTSIHRSKVGLRARLPAPRQRAAVPNLSGHRAQDINMMMYVVKAKGSDNYRGYMCDCDRIDYMCYAIKQARRALALLVVYSPPRP